MMPSSESTWQAASLCPSGRT